ncbi:Uncharacterized protein Y39B6A.33 [Toxocara canis]|uniref:Ribosome biogenesis protein NOP53 n=1 Tax=Toxocara canis TaxID=6265 RepID=A0A0B2UVR8_TOXCA|nr:Uncharacterized protein Y39B6A.33 [Toxocara canis]
MASGTKKLRIARNKKRYWRKGTRLDDVEQFLQDEYAEQSEGGPVRERVDSELFTIDRAPETLSNRLTRKQIAAINKRQLLQRIDAVENDVKPSKSELKRSFPKKKKPASVSQKRPCPPALRLSSKPYDLWADGENKQPSAELALIEDHYLKSTKRRKPREPRTLKHMPSLLPSVEIVEPGASYNPTLSSYQNYVNSIAEEEAKVGREQEKLQKALSLAPGQTYVSQSDIMEEESAGLFDETEEVEDEADSNPIGVSATGDTKKSATTKQKTSRRRRLEALEKKKKLMQQAEKKAKNVEQVVFTVKKLNKEICKELSTLEEKAKLRLKRKLADRLLGTQQLGRGKFTPEDRPFLLTDELSGSLRELKPQGDVLVARLKSLQKRNMMPVPGEKRIRSKLKKKLRVKKIEKRSHKEVTLGSRVI